MHMILRGISRAAIFFADPDWYLFLATLAELALAKSVGVHADVVMTNRIHLLMAPGTDSDVSRLMKGLGERYV